MKNLLKGTIYIWLPIFASYILELIFKIMGV